MEFGGRWRRKFNHWQKGIEKAEEKQVEMGDRIRMKDEEEERSLESYEVVPDFGASALHPL